MWDDLLTGMVWAGAAAGAFVYGVYKAVIAFRNAKDKIPVAAGVGSVLVDRDIGDRLIDQFERLNGLVDAHSRETVVSTKRAAEEMIELRRVAQAICERMPRA